MLGVLLCYNDGDLVSDAVRYLIDQGHDVIAWDHGSDDETSDILRRLSPELVELRTIPRSFDFYDLYPEMSRHLLADYVDRYDWISWPDQDEFLEGPEPVMVAMPADEEVHEKASHLNIQVPPDTCDHTGVVTATPSVV